MTTLKTAVSQTTSVADPDLQIGGRGDSGLQNIVFSPFGPQSGLKIRGGLAPSPGSATEHRFELCYADLKGFQETAPKSHPRYCIDAEMTYYVHSPWDLTRLTQ